MLTIFSQLSKKISHWTLVPTKNAKVQLLCIVRNWTSKEYISEHWFNPEKQMSHSNTKYLNSFVSARFRGFSEKKRLNARGFAREFLQSSMLYRPSKSLKRCGKSSSLHSQKIFLLGGCRLSVSDVISGGLLGYLGPLWLALGANR